MFIENLRASIGAVGIAEVHRKTGISRSILNNFARGRSSMTAENLEKTMTALGVEYSMPFKAEIARQLICDPKKKLDIFKIAKILKKTYAAEKVILFGSQAKGNWTKSSDIDFLVVRSNDRKSIDPGQERIETFNQKIESRYDVVTVAANSLEKSLSDTASVIATAFKTGIVLYE